MSACTHGAVIPSYFVDSFAVCHTVNYYVCVRKHDDDDDEKSVPVTVEILRGLR